MAKYKLTAIVNTDVLTLPKAVDVNDMPALQEFLETDPASPTLAELWNMKLERVEGE